MSQSSGGWFPVPAEATACSPSPPTLYTVTYCMVTAATASALMPSAPFPPGSPDPFTVIPMRPWEPYWVTPEEASWMTAEPEKAFDGAMIAPCNGSPPMP